MAKRVVKFNRQVKGRYGTRRYHEFKADVPYPVDDYLLDAIERIAGKKLWIEVAQKSILDKKKVTSKKSTAKKDISTVGAVSKDKITRRSVNK